MQTSKDQQDRDKGKKVSLFPSRSEKTLSINKDTEQSHQMESSFPFYGPYSLVLHCNIKPTQKT